MLLAMASCIGMSLSSFCNFDMPISVGPHSIIITAKVPGWLVCGVYHVSFQALEINNGSFPTN